jgi:hypothetical protein
MNPFAGVTGQKAFLIVAPDQFMPAVQPLVAHKNLTGMPTIAVSISSITSYFQGVDDAEKIKRAIQYAHENLLTQFVMLVGDAANFPVRFWFLHDSGYVPVYPGTSQPISCQPSGMFIQSDLYYASLYHHTGTPPTIPGAFDTWDANNNGLYNEAWMGNSPPINPGGLNTASNPDNVDGYPDVAVGRVPARNISDITAYVQKIIAYESGDSQNATATFAFVHDQIYGSLNLTTGMVNSAGLPKSDAAVSFLLIDNGSNAAPPPFSNIASPQIANQAGVSTWLSYVGHGNAQVWGGNGSFQWSDVAPAKNLPALPVVFAAGCQTSLFMTNTPWSNKTIDANGVTRGPFIIEPTAKPNVPGLVMTDQSTGKKWGLNTPGCDPLPVPTPRPNPIQKNNTDNCANPCWANPWLFDYAPGGAIAYFGDHCVAPDSYPVQIETNLLKAYVSSSNPVLGSLYLTAQQQYWAGPDSNDATNPNLGDYHGIPRLYLGWLVFFGDPSLRLPPLNGRLAQRVGDLDGDGVAEILVTSPWGIAILKLAGASMTPLLIAANGTSFGSWTLQTANTCFGPLADYDGDGHDEILVTSPAGIAILKLAGTTLTALTSQPNGSSLGAWTLDTSVNCFGPTADYDGDGHDEILVTSPWGIGILKLAGDTFTSPVIQPNGTRLGGWALDTSNNKFGPAADYDGNGHAEILVTSSWGIAVLAVSGNTFISPVIQSNGTRLGTWILDTSNNKFGPAADYDQDLQEEILVTSPWGIGLLKLSGNTFISQVIQPNGTSLGGWTLDTSNNQFGPAAAYDGSGAAEILVTSPWGIAILKTSGNTFTSPIIQPNGTRFGGWVLDTTANRFGSIGGYTSDVLTEILVTSPWGIAILKPSGNTFTTPMIQPNGTRFGGWLLETTSNVF